MRKNVFIKVISLTVLVVLIFSGCSHKNKAKEENLSNNTTQKSIQNEVQGNKFDNEYWHMVKEYSGCIGKDFSQIVSNRGVAYAWDGENKQSVLGMDDLFFNFPKLVWEDSTCSAIAVGAYNILQGTDKATYLNSSDIKKYFGNGYVYQKGESNEETYEYEFDGMKVIICEISNQRADEPRMYILIKTQEDKTTISELIAQNKLHEITIGIEKRETKNWSNLNEYIANLGKSKKELIAANENWTLNEDSNIYENLNTKIGYGFDASENCDYISIPAKFLMNINKKMTMKEMVDYFNMPFTWFSYEETDYRYRFDDVEVLIPSDESGIVEEDVTIEIIRKK